MALVVGTDTFATLVEADAYVNARPFFAEWKAVTTVDASKEAALRMAAVQLSSMYVWAGTITDLAQIMPWPRTDVVDDEGREIDVDTIPEKIKYAQIELAYQWLIADQLTPNPTLYTAADVGRQLKREKLGPLEKEYFQENSFLYDLSEGRMKTKVYPLIDMYVKPYIVRRTGSAWTPSNF